MYDEGIYSVYMMRESMCVFLYTACVVYMFRVRPLSYLIHDANIIHRVTITLLLRVSHILVLL